MELLPVLRALADPSRLRIVEMLREREQCVCHLLERLGLTQGTVSHHMAVLKRVGLVRDRRDDSDARWVYYSLTPEARRWGQRLADLLDTTQVDPVPADCAGRSRVSPGPETICSTQNSEHRHDATGTRHQGAEQDSALSTQDSRPRADTVRGGL